MMTVRGASKMVPCLIAMIVLVCGCRSKPTTPAAPAPPPPDPNDYINVSLNCTSSAAGWVIATQDTEVFLPGMGTCGASGVNAYIRFNPGMPLDLTLTCVALDGDSIRCKSFSRSYPAQDSVQHPPAIAYDESRDIPDQIAITGPDYICSEVPTIPQCHWAGIGTGIIYEGAIVGYWPDGLATNWGYPPGWTACAMAAPARLVSVLRPAQAQTSR